MSAASVSSRSNVLRTRLEELTEREAMLLEALQQTRAELGQTREQMVDTERAKAPSKRAAIADETWRRIVRELRTFTVSELATELGCSKAIATRHLKTMVATGMVAPAGRVLGKALYEYAEHTVPEAVEPAPEATEAVREHRRHLQAVVVPQRGAPVEGTGRGLTVANKDVRQACEEAERRGWKLIKKGDGHFVLTKGTRRVSVAGSPKSGTDSADLVRRMTR